MKVNENYFWDTENVFSANFIVFKKMSLNSSTEVRSKIKLWLMILNLYLQNVLLFSDFGIMIDEVSYESAFVNK